MNTAEVLHILNHAVLLGTRFPLGNEFLWPYGKETLWRRKTLFSPTNVAGKQRLRSCIDLARRTDLLYPSMVHDDDPVGEHHGFLLVVRYIYKRYPERSPQMLELGLQILPQLQIQCAKRFIQQQHLRFVGNGAGDGHALPLSAGQLVREAFRRAVSCVMATASSTRSLMSWRGIFSFSAQKRYYLLRSYAETEHSVGIPDSNPACSQVFPSHSDPPARPVLWLAVRILLSFGESSFCRSRWGPAKSGIFFNGERQRMHDRLSLKMLRSGQVQSHASNPSSKCDLFHVYIPANSMHKNVLTKKKRSYCLLCSGWQNPFLKVEDARSLD